jgi:hypothetical protein
MSDGCPQVGSGGVHSDGYYENDNGCCRWCDERTRPKIILVNGPKDGWVYDLARVSTRRLRMPGPGGIFGIQCYDYDDTGEVNEDGYRVFRLVGRATLPGEQSR